MASTSVRLATVGGEIHRTRFDSESYNGLGGDRGDFVTAFPALTFRPVILGLCFCFARDLGRKPVTTFRGHALVTPVIVLVADDIVLAEV